MAEKNHVQVMIEGKLMTLVGTESPEYMKSVAEYIEEKNKEIRSGENGRKMNVAMASILTSINVADDYFKEKSKRENIQTEFEILKEKLSETESELEEARKEIEQLNRDIYILKDDMRRLRISLTNILSPLTQVKIFHIKTETNNYKTVAGRKCEICTCIPALFNILEE